MRAFALPNSFCRISCLLILSLLSSTILIAPLDAQVPVRTKSVDTARELNMKGIELQSTGKLKEAVECYRRAIQINAFAAGYHNNLALALKDLGELTTAESEARIALKLRPKRADYFYNLGIILQRQKRLTEAEASFRQALEIDAADTDCHFRLVQVLLTAAGETQSLEPAEQEIKLAIMLKPDRAEYCELLGDIYMKEKKFDDAFIQYKSVVEIKGFTAATIPGELKAKIDFIKAALKPAN